MDSTCVKLTEELNRLKCLLAVNSFFSQLAAGLCLGDRVREDEAEARGLQKGIDALEAAISSLAASEPEVSDER